MQLKIVEKVVAAQPEGPLGVLFKKWSGAGVGQKGSAKAKSVDFKEFSAICRCVAARTPARPPARPSALAFSLYHSKRRSLLRRSKSE